MEDLDQEALLEQVLAYKAQAPDSPIKDMITNLCKALSYAKQGMIEALGEIDDLENELQDYRCDLRFMPVLVRLRATGGLMIHSYDDGQQGYDFYSHLIERGYVPIEQEQLEQSFDPDGDDENYRPHWNPDEDPEGVEPID